jgi:hypothetical protein
MEKCNLKKLNDLEVKEQYQAKISNRFASLENVDDDDDDDDDVDDVGIKRFWESIRQNIKALKKSAQNKLHQRKQAKFQWFQNPSKTN